MLPPPPTSNLNLTALPLQVNTIMKIRLPHHQLLIKAYRILQYFPLEEMATSRSHPLQLHIAKAKFQVSMPKRLRFSFSTQSLFIECKFYLMCSRQRILDHSSFLGWEFHTGRWKPRRQESILLTQ